LSVAVDLQGPEVVKPFTTGTTFPTVVDSSNWFSREFNFTIVPNGILVDENGIIRMVKQGFQVTKEEHTGPIIQWIQGEIETVTLDDVYVEPSQVDRLQQELADAKFKLGLEYAGQGRKEEALQQLDEALSYHPDNFLIRKQRWYLRYPEKFNPVIDFEWQKEILAKEKEEEAKAQGEVCGPEGCRLPGS
jgi:tetratricopeptide (TPR) repeat protein